MTQQGAALQTCNNELVKCIEELVCKRDELNKQIQQEEEEKARLQHDIHVLTERLNRVSESLECYLATCNELDRTDAETDAACMKAVERSQIQEEEQEKTRLQHDIHKLMEKLKRVSESVERHLAARNELDRTIAETEAPYLRILESSQTLINALKPEADELDKDTDSSSSEDMNTPL